MTPVFTESQGLGMWIIILMLLVLLFVGRIINRIRRRDGGVSVSMKILFGIVFLVPLVVLIISVISRLNTRIDAKGVHYSYFPFINQERVIPWDSISRAYIRSYHPLKEYGGWGIRTGGHNNDAYNASGHMGLQLELMNGKHILIGTQEPDSVKITINELVRDHAISNAFMQQ